MSQFAALVRALSAKMELDSSGNTQEETTTVPPASVPLLQQTKQGEDLDTGSKQAVTSTWGTSAPAPSSPSQSTQSTHTQTPPGLVEAGATSNPAPASTARLQSTESPRPHNPALSSKPSPAVVPQPVPILNLFLKQIQSINAAAVSFKTTPAGPFNSHSQSSEPVKPAALSFRPASGKTTVSPPLPRSSKPSITESKNSETSATAETPDKSSQPPTTNTPVNPPSTSFAQFQPPATSSTNTPVFSTKDFTFLSQYSSLSALQPTNTPTSGLFAIPSSSTPTPQSTIPPTSSIFATPPSSTSVPQSTRSFGSSSHFTKSGFNYTPPVFGIPTAIPSRHSNVKSPFTAGVSGFSGQILKSPISFGTSSNTGGIFPGTNVSAINKNLFNKGEAIEGCRQQ